MFHCTFVPPKMKNLLILVVKVIRAHVPSMNSVCFVLPI